MTLDILLRARYALHMTMTPQFVTDAAGERTAVLLPIAEYEQIMEDLADLSAIADRRDESTVPHEEMLLSLKADGLLPT